MTSSFPATRWSIIAAATASDGGNSAQVALAELCRIYWFPLYAFARRKGLSAEDAEDATQTFFQHLLESEMMSAANPTLGRMRTFLLKAFSDKLIDLKRAEGRLKRGGGVQFISLDLSEAELRYEMSPTMDFEASWATALLEAAVRKLETDYTDSDRREIFSALLPYLGTSTGEPPDQAQLATQLGMSHAAFRQSLARFRERFRITLRSTVADTLREPTESAINEELRMLSSILIPGS